MDGADAAGMTGAPGLQKIERLGSADLADRNAVGSQTERGANEIRERGDLILGAQSDQVRRSTLQLARILDEDDAIVCLGDFGKQRVGEGGLAGRCTAGDEDVAALGDCVRSVSACAV